jgi:hypothetical protein
LRFNGLWAFFISGPLESEVLLAGPQGETFPSWRREMFPF